MCIHRKKKIHMKTPQQKHSRHVDLTCHERRQKHVCWQSQRFSLSGNSPKEIFHLFNMKCLPRTQIQIIGVVGNVLQRQQPLRPIVSVTIVSYNDPVSLRKPTQTLHLHVPLVTAVVNPSGNKILAAQCRSAKWQQLI